MHTALRFLLRHTIVVLLSLLSLTVLHFDVTLFRELLNEVLLELSLDGVAGSLAKILIIEHLEEVFEG